MKKIIIMLACVFLMTGVSVSAYNYPNAFWKANENYISALNSGDYSGIVKYGEEIIGIMSSAPSGREKTEIIVSRYNEVGIASEKLGLYDKSAEAFRQVILNADLNYPEHRELIKGAKARVLQYETRAEMYVSGGDGAFMGAKNEKENGVLFGVCADSETSDKLNNASMVLVYQELSEDLLPYNRQVVANAAEEGRAVLFALNCLNEGTDIRNITDYRENLLKISDLFREYPQTPIYLRFGAEFDVWRNMSESVAYKNAFMYVADIFHSRNPNVAMVWNPSRVSAWNVCRDDFYPGDSYVDWVGISLYSNEYFLGDKSQSEFNNIYFKSGDASDPVLAAEDIIKTYGDRKPIMISEYGAGHRLVNTGEDMTDFALSRLRETYAYLPIVYPEIKLIAYFDAFANNGIEVYDYRLSTNEKLQNEFIGLTKGRRFVQDSYGGAVDTHYKRVDNGTWVDSVFEVSLWCHKCKKTAEKVTYFIDNTYVGMSDEIPYSTFIDAREYPGGHILGAVIEFTDGEILRTEKYINISPEGTDITVEISGRRIDFSVDPVIYNERTMVPLRGIFEELGAVVSWNGDTKTVTAKKGVEKITITVGETKLYVNGKAHIIDTPPFIINGSTLVPVRAIAEGFGCDVLWDGENSRVLIKTN